MSDAYPAGREVDVILRDGSSVHVRPVREDDRDAMAEFFSGLTDASRGFRFFSAVADVKTDLGAVRLGLSGRQQVADAAAGIDEGLRRAGVRRERLLIQAMVEGGVEMLIGVVGDAVFGPVVACGAGGVEAELLNDMAVRLSPLTSLDVDEMLHSLATFPLLTGYRGAPEVDLKALQELLLRTSAMVEAHHEIAELDLNPVIVDADGIVAVDARVRVETAAPRRSWPSAWSSASGPARHHGHRYARRTPEG